MKRDPYHQKRSFKPVRLSIPKEVAHHEDGKHKQDDHKDLKIEVHRLTYGPSDYHHKRAIEQGCLDGWAKAVV